MDTILFRSTRKAFGAVEESPVGIETAIVRGMPPDGGLYVPTSFPKLPGRVLDPSPLNYAELALLVLEPYFGNWNRDRLKAILDRAYGNDRGQGADPYFDIPDIVTLKALGGDLHAESPFANFYVMELFHGRTCAFKDLALSVLGGLLRESLDMLGMKEPVLVLAATSGDTGSAALEGLAGVEGVKTAVFYPSEGTSEIQRLQMTTTDARGRFVAGIKGNFDDAQAAVKSVFSRASRGEGPLASFRLSSANSINIGRLLPQIVYYVAAWRSLAASKALGPTGTMNVVVPTGNFGDILAAKYAKSMGLPIDVLVSASNANKVVADFFATGAYDARRDLMKTDSPSMDILVSSNLERLLFMAAGSDPVRTTALMRELASDSWFEIDSLEKIFLSDFRAGWCGDGTARSMIAEVWNNSGLLVDPHSAVALAVGARVARDLDPATPVVVASTASPFKFPRACAESLLDSGTRVLGEGAIIDDSGDLDIAAALSGVTGVALPSAIASLKGKEIVHGRILAVDEVESAIASFAAEGSAAC